MNPEDYRDQVEYHARRAASAGRASDLDDHRQDGWLGLLMAEKRYDSDNGAQLQTFARERIRGQIIDGIRKRHPFGATASRHHHDIPTYSLDAPGAPDIPVQPGVESEIATAEREQAVRDTIDALPEQYAQLLWLRYFEELDMCAIARRMGMCRSNAFRTHNRALSMFRERWSKCGRA